MYIPFKFANKLMKCINNNLESCDWTGQRYCSGYKEKYSVLAKDKPIRLEN